MKFFKCCEIETNCERSLEYRTELNPKRMKEDSENPAKIYIKEANDPIWNECCFFSQGKREFWKKSARRAKIHANRGRIEKIYVASEKKKRLWSSVYKL